MARRMTADTVAVEKICPVCRMTFTHEKYVTPKNDSLEFDSSLRAVSQAAPERNPLHYDVLTCPSCSYSAFEPDFDQFRPASGDPNAKKNECLASIKTYGITDLKQFTELRELRHGMASYACAEIWYRDRADLPVRMFRMGLCGYRLIWLIDDAMKDGLITKGDARAMQFHTTRRIAPYLEQSFLSEKFPAQFHFGPDVNINLGHLCLSYMIAYLNLLTSNSSNENLLARQLYLQKAEKYGIASASQARALKQVSMTAKTGGLREEIKKTAKALGLQLEQIEKGGSDDPPGVDRAVSHETLRWELPFEKLFSQHGLTAKDGEIIIRQDEKSCHMYFILSGLVSVFRTYNIAGQVKHNLLATLGEGAFFGEMALIDASERFATVKAVAPTRLIRLDYEGFKKIVQAYPEMAIRMIEVLIRRLRSCDLNIQKKLLEVEKSLSVKVDSKESQQQTRVRNTGLAVDLGKIVTDLMKSQ